MWLKNFYQIAQTVKSLGCCNRKDLPWALFWLLVCRPCYRSARWCLRTSCELPHGMAPCSGKSLFCSWVWPLPCTKVVYGGHATYRILQVLRIVPTVPSLWLRTGRSLFHGVSRPRLQGPRGTCWHQSLKGKPAGQCGSSGRLCRGREQRCNCNSRSRRWVRSGLLPGTDPCSRHQWFLSKQPQRLTRF